MGRDAKANPFTQWKQTQQATVTTAYDQFGRAIGVGDFLVIAEHGAILWRVTESSPVMDPKMPPGLVRLALAAHSIVPVNGGQPLPGVVKVRDVLEYMTPEQLQQALQGAEKASGVGDPSRVPPGGSEHRDGPLPEAPTAPPEPSRIVLP